jgi:hypothetical protein
MSHKPVVTNTRIYDARAEGDGRHALVDRVWRRALSRARATAVLAQGIDQRAIRRTPHQGHGRLAAVIHRAVARSR